MLNDTKEKCTKENCLKYFSFFNHKLYETPSDLQIEEYSTKSDTDSHSIEGSCLISSNESFDSKNIEEKFIPLNLLNISPKKITYPSPKFELNEIQTKNININKCIFKEIQPDLQKYKLPKSLFNTSKNKEIEKEKKDSLAVLIDKNLNLSSQPFMPKNKENVVVMNNNFNNVSFYINSMGNKFDQIPMNYLKYNNCLKNNKKKKKKKEFVEREGDWSCYRCKNINFSFRNICNKCHFSKEESEKKFNEVGEALLKLADMSIYDKK